MFLLHPLALLLLIVPLYFFLRRHSTASHSIERHIPPEILQKLTLKRSLIAHRLRTDLFLLALGLFILALARPVKPKETLSLSQARSSVIVAVDFSKSMHQKDIYPSRLTLALKKLDTLLQKAQELNIGILFYAKEAYMLYPLSQNPKLLHSLLKDANITQKFSEHTNLFAPVEASQILLKDHPNRHLLLLSDGGAEIERDAELNYLRAHHTQLSLLAITPDDLHAMQRLCKQSGGIYVHYSWGDDDIETLLDFFQRAPVKKETYRYTLSQYDELYPYPLLGGIILLLLLWLPHRSRLLLPIIALGTVTLTPTPSHAGVLDLWQHYQKRKRYNLATKTYRQKRYIDAVALYTQALGDDRVLDAKIYHNIATAYLRVHKLRLAKQYYEKSLRSFALPQARENLMMVKQLLKAERKNLHKKYQKLHFKAIAPKERQYQTPFTSYAVKLHKLQPSEEERWFQKVLQHRSPLYLQKIPTRHRSTDANISW